MNVIITCAGRRNYLIKYFKAALGSTGLVYAGDADPTAPALYEADRGFIMPSIDDVNYINELLKLCRANRIQLVVPTTDLELPLLAEHRDEFLTFGTVPLISSETVVNICFDKWRTADFCYRSGVGYPRTFLRLEETRQAVENGIVSFPLVVKPRWGSASIGIEFVEDEEELGIAYQLVNKRIARTVLAKINVGQLENRVLIQEALTGQEFGIDVVNDLNGKFCGVFIRKKIAMRAGETDKAETVDEPVLFKLGQKISEHLKHIGNLDCDIFLSGSRSWLLEMNPRFGGGYPFSHLAGADLPRAIVAWIKGEKVNLDWLRPKPGVIAAKYYELKEIGFNTEKS